MKIGTDDIRAPEHTHRPRSIFRSEFPELHSPSWPFGKSIYENPIHAADRINVPGYRCVRELYSSPSLIVADKIVDGLLAEDYRIITEHQVLIIELSKYRIVLSFKYV